jgi:geranylgeranyl diphosphate synthase type I
MNTRSVDALDQWMDHMLPEIERELQSQIRRLDQPSTLRFHEMLTYHMGWTGPGAGPQASGKRIRPLLLLLTSAACGKDWMPALPAAAAVELVHNFSLVHDDVQDNSDVRRGRATVWKNWGVPMAINVGDALFVIANLAVVDLSRSHPPELVMHSARILNTICLDLTRGQFLDMSYEERSDLSMNEYWPMIGGKTSALLSACTQIGALIGGASESIQDAYRQFGYHLGLAFQIQDDILGIWGNEQATGKSASSDLVEGKNSLPILYGLENSQDFRERWGSRPVNLDQVKPLSDLLEKIGARHFAELQIREQTSLALSHLEKAMPGGDAGKALWELTNRLLNRLK